MTAINTVTTTAAAHLITDGVAYLPDGTLLGLGTKTFTAPHLPMALAARGISVAPFLIGPMMVGIYATFDDLVAGIEDTLPYIFDEYLAQFPVAGASSCDDLAGLKVLELVIAGWSEARQAGEAYMIRTHEINLNADRVDGGIPVVPAAFQLVRLDSIVACPFPLPSAMASRPPIDLDPSYDEVRLRRGLIELMELQRASLYPPMLPGRTERHIVGGFAQMTTVTREGIYQKIIHRWPEDRVGEKIKPRQPIKAA
jgi:hypothetical protein